MTRCEICDKSTTCNSIFGVSDEDFYEEQESDVYLMRGTQDICNECQGHIHDAFLEFGAVEVQDEEGNYHRRTWITNTVKKSLDRSGNP